MGQIIQTQHCISADPWFEILIDSSSVPGLQYIVKVPYPDDPVDELICECEGFNYRGHCKHQAEAFAILCQWHELDGPEQQTKDQAKGHICPRCGDITIKESEWVD